MRRIALKGSPQFADQLRRLGIDDAPAEGWFAREIDEADPRWPAIEDWYRRVSGGPIGLETKFTRAEIEQAQTVHLRPAWFWSYPQPEMQFPDSTITYDLSNYCRKCGAGLRQVGPFQLKGEPKWGTKNMLQLNWIFGEFFVTPQLWRDVFQPFGIGVREVQSTRGTVLDSVVQLVINQEVLVDTSCAKGSVCPACGTERFEWVTRGYRPEPLQPVATIAHSTQWFGSGGSTSHTIVISAQLRQALQHASAKGMRFDPSGPCTPQE